MLCLPIKFELLVNSQSYYFVYILITFWSISNCSGGGDGKCGGDDNNHKNLHNVQHSHITAAQPALLVKALFVPPWWINLKTPENENVQFTSKHNGNI